MSFNFFLSISKKYEKVDLGQLLLLPAPLLLQSLNLVMEVKHLLIVPFTKVTSTFDKSWTFLPRQGLPLQKPFDLSLQLQVSEMFI